MSDVCAAHGSKYTKMSTTATYGRRGEGALNDFNFILFIFTKIKSMVYVTWKI